jgi:hypothetical protein
MGSDEQEELATGGKEITNPTAYMEVLGGLVIFGVTLGWPPPILGKGKPFVEPTELVGVDRLSPPPDGGMLRPPS